MPATMHISRRRLRARKCASCARCPGLRASHARASVRNVREALWRIAHLTNSKEPMPRWGIQALRLYEHPDQPRKPPRLVIASAVFFGPILRYRSVFPGDAWTF